MTSPTVIVYGPPASGKSRNAKTLALHFGCSAIIDGWDASKTYYNGALHLAQTSRNLGNIPKPVHVISIDDALFEAGITHEGVPVVDKGEIL